MPIRNQVIPGALSWRIGSKLVTTLSDGYIEATLEGNLRGVSKLEAAELQRKAFRSEDPRYTVSAFLVESDDEAPILIDTGMGQFGGAVAGHLLESLRLAKVQPDEIGTVLLTHLHLDHSGGLVNPAGEPVFPNAQLLVHEAEVKFWLAEDAATSPGQNHPEWVEPTRNVVRPMASRLKTFKDGDSVANDLTAVHLPGHTPGHSGFALQIEAERVLFWGDIVHMPAIQMAMPQAGVDADSDPKQAESTRRATLASAAASRTLVAGAHLEFPAFGFIQRAGDEFHFVPELWVSRI
ncbi:MBL fold metallo-hydrolase [Acidicapsa ligni]|uniref:MBL fold metallo-hydrolase n=1 Tax=Acidicapsa ligni TaxID=542300 RepID=UPI0021E0C0AA|nr:MBL fold metallo-hydrolase [Acidicapsa ligni]